MSARERFTRIVSLVAGMTRRAGADADGVSLGVLAAEHEVTVADINADIGALTVLGDRCPTDWLSSLSVWQQDERVFISSAGPFRRPVRFSPEEQLAVQVALALHPSGSALAVRFASHFAGRDAGTPTRHDDADDRLLTLNRAVRERREVNVSYTAGGERTAVNWLLEPHQVADSHGRTYIVAFVVALDEFRHFRLDRMLSVALTERTFEGRAGFQPLEKPTDVFRPTDTMDRVMVRFAASAAPSVRELYPDHDLLPDGRVEVTFTAANAEWMVRKVLEYGAEAEVIEPEQYRRAMMEAVA